MSAPEAFHRLSEYPLHKNSHTVVRLAVHLPNRQLVYFVEGDKHAAAERAAQQETSLTAWFRLCSESEEARQYLYGQIPQHYVLRKLHGVHTWTRRQRQGDSVVSRIYSVSPREGERFYLRLLLLHVRGATNFADLRTVDGVECATFREACLHRHLLENDNTWESTLREAAAFQMPKQLRVLFCTVVCQVWVCHDQKLGYLHTFYPLNISIKNRT